MGAEGDRNAELLRRFETVISGAGLDDLRQLGNDLSLLGAWASGRVSPPAPDLRRPRLTHLRILRLRVDLKGARPPIWRRLEVRSDLTLDVVHRVLQAAFGWTDSHLHRFSLGGGPFDRASQHFLCPWDVEEGEFEDEGGLPAGAVRLDETLQDPGDVLAYAYDYGDGWELTLRLEDVLAAAPDAPSAVAIDGRRAAPPEDCGGLLDAQSLAEVVQDPAHFDLDPINAQLRSELIMLSELGLDPDTVELINRLSYSSVGGGLAARALAALADRTAPDEQALLGSLRAFVWFLDRAVGDGFRLTSAGYLTPADVQAAARVVPAMGGWIGTPNRETDTGPVLSFRGLLQSLGLLRKYKGTLRLTRAGAAVQMSHERLWSTLADRLLPEGDGFDSQATRLLLLYAATSPETELPLGEVADALTHLGWRTADGEPVDPYDLYRLPVLDVLRNIATESVDRGHRLWISSGAAALALTALWRV